LISGVLEPYFMNPTEWNLKGYTGFIWGATAFATFVWAYFRLPETKGRTFEDLDILFAKRVPAKRFKDIDVNGFEGVDPVEVARKVSEAGMLG
jgi:SP family general alpha glucoside:H+ symporter-like MFS transporter